MIPFVLREMTDLDKSFIYNSFLISYKAHSMSKYISNFIYFEQQAKIITELFKISTTLIACFPEAPDEIMGYIIYEYLKSTPIVHWCYIKKNFRHNGMFRTFLETITNPDHTAIICTHIPDYFGNLQYKIQDKRLTYDPYFLNIRK